MNAWNNNDGQLGFFRSVNTQGQLHACSRRRILFVEAYGRSITFDAVGKDLLSIDNVALNSVVAKI